ncbi:MAG: chromate transporter [Acidaminococcaceae bacterium]|jgi:chromate transporter|nr:chromate transporter [Acidaminococcaceae bacterium]
MDLYLKLFLEFAKTGLFAIGGGMATIPFLTKMSDETGWFTHMELLNMIAVSESTPGPIGVNMASYVGYHLAGISGSIVATVGLVFPSLIIILIVAQFLKRFGDSPIVKAVMYGLRAASAGLIAAAGISVAKVTLFNVKALGTGNWGGFLNIKAIILAVILFYLTKKYKKVHPVAFLAASAIIGVVFNFA